MKKNILLIALVVVTATAFLGFSKTGTEAESTKSGKEEVKIGIMTSGFTLPLYYAEAEKYFEKEGLSVSIEYFTNGPAINEAIAAGDIDVAGIGEMPAVTGSIANNSKIVAWMSDDEYSIKCYARNDSDIVKTGKGHIEGYPDIYGTADEWKGKEVIVSKGTSSYYGLLSTLNALGLTENDIAIINMSGSQGAAAFASGTGDIFYGFDPQWAAFHTTSDQFTEIATCENSGSSLFTVLMASNDFATNHKEALTKVLRAMLLSEQTFMNDKSTYYNAMYEWQNTFSSCTKELAKYSAQLKQFRSFEDQKAMFTEVDGTTEMMKSLDNVADFMIKNQVITEEDKATLDKNNPVVSDCLIDAINSLSK